MLLFFYGHTSELTNKLTGSKNSFEETKKGIQNLISFNVEVEVRTLLTLATYKLLPEITGFMISTFPSAIGYGVCALDTIGNAKMHQEKLTVKLNDATPYLENALDIAKRNNVKLALYNIPLCIINPKKWISIRFPLWQTELDEQEIYKSPQTLAKKPLGQFGKAKPAKCVNCKAKRICPGVWSSYINEFGEET